MDATNYPHNERKDLISNDVSGINTMIRNIFDIHDTSWKFENPNFIAPLFYETDKFGIFTYMKGGSSLLNNILTQYKLINIDYNQTRFSEVFYETMGFDKEIEPKERTLFSEFYKITKGESEKDLIIPIRNSCKKWVSGVIQELMFEYNDSPLLQEILGDSVGLHIDNLSKEDINKLVLSKLRNLNASEYGMLVSHHMLYNETLYNFLELNPHIDKSKLRIIDIDSTEGDLRNIVAEYYPQVLEDDSNEFQSHRDFYVKFLEAISDELINKDTKENKQIVNTMRRAVSQDYYYYTLIHRKYHNLIYK